MGKIFISYRRADSQFVTDRIYEHLARHFSSKSLFKDVDNIPPGVDFRTHVDKAVAVLWRKRHWPKKPAVRT